VQKLGAVRQREIETVFTKLGWRYDRTVGSHHQWIRPGQPGIVKVKEQQELYHDETLSLMLRQIGVTKRASRICSTECRRRGVKYTVLMTPQSDGGYTAFVPSLPGCVTEGPSFDEALAFAGEAAAGWIETAAAHGMEIPTEAEGTAVAQIDVQTPVLVAAS
jgi:antitoxin HicB